MALTTGPTEEVARLLANSMEVELPAEGHNIISWFCKGPQATLSFWERSPILHQGINVRVFMTC
jgi:hypothetical protein